MNRTFNAGSSLGSCSLAKQIDILQKQADKLRTREVDGVVSRIKVAIAHCGWTATQWGFGTAAAGKRKTASAMKLGSTCGAASYADGQGRTWSGRGPRPAWLREALANGKSLQDFASGAAPAPTRCGATTRSKEKAECETQIRYRDQAGNTWSGMGPQPRGLKEAVAAGTSLEQVAA